MSLMIGTRQAVAGIATVFGLALGGCSTNSANDNADLRQDFSGCLRKDFKTDGVAITNECTDFIDTKVCELEIPIAFLEKYKAKELTDEIIKKNIKARCENFMMTPKSTYRWVGEKENTQDSESLIAFMVVACVQEENEGILSLRATKRYKAVKCAPATSLN